MQSNFYHNFAKPKRLDPNFTFTRASIGTYFDSLGVLRATALGVPRITHDTITGVSGGLLVEDSRTNLLTYSEQFDNAAWSKTGTTTVTPNALTSPDGLLTADLVSDTDAINPSLISMAATAQPVGTVVTGSIFVSAGTAAKSTFNCYETGNTECNLNVTWLAGVPTLGSFTGPVGASYAIEFVGKGWYRLSITWTIAFAVTISHRFWICDRATPAATGTVYLWGAQLEVGAFQSSYIPTAAVAVTRAADIVSMTGTSFSEWFNPVEGTLLVEFTAGYVANRIISISDSTLQSNLFTIRQTTASNVNVQIRVADVVTADFNATVTAGGRVVVVLGYKVNNTNAAINGVLGTLDTACAIPVVDRLVVGASATGTTQANTYIAAFSYFPRRLTDAELQKVSI